MALVAVSVALPEGFGVGEQHDQSVDVGTRAHVGVDVHVDVHLLAAGHRERLVETSVPATQTARAVTAVLTPEVERAATVLAGVDLVDLPGRVGGANGRLVEPVGALTVLEVLGEQLGALVREHALAVFAVAAVDGARALVIADLAGASDALAVLADVRAGAGIAVRALRGVGRVRTPLHLVAGVVGAGVAVVAVDLLAGADLVLADIPRGAGASVRAGCGVREEHASALRVAAVVGARVLVVADRVQALRALEILAGLGGALVAVIAGRAFVRGHALAGRGVVVAGLVGARVVVVTVDELPLLAGGHVLAVRDAAAAVLRGAVLGRPERVALVVRARVAVVLAVLVLLALVRDLAGSLLGAATVDGRGALLVGGALLAVAADVVRLAFPRLAVATVRGARVAIIADLLDRPGGALAILANVVGVAGIVVRAGDAVRQRDATLILVAGLGGADVAVILADGRRTTGALPAVADVVDGARVVVVAGQLVGDVDTAGLGVAAVSGARVRVVALDELLRRADAAHASRFLGALVAVVALAVAEAELALAVLAEHFRDAGVAVGLADLVGVLGGAGDAARLGHVGATVLAVLVAGIHRALVTVVAVLLGRRALAVLADVVGAAVVVGAAGAVRQRDAALLAVAGLGRAHVAVVRAGLGASVGAGTTLTDVVHGADVVVRAGRGVGQMRALAGLAVAAVIRAHVAVVAAELLGLVLAEPLVA